jgi:hypothetical protein
LHCKYKTTLTNNKNQSTYFSYDFSKSFYFGDTISFHKYHFFYRKLNDVNNFYFKNSIKDNKKLIQTLQENNAKAVKYQIEMDSKFLIFGFPLNKELSINKLTKDTLILHNNSYHKNDSIVYIKLKKANTNK